MLVPTYSMHNTYIYHVQLVACHTS